jgi:hypothetical protein
VPPAPKPPEVRKPDISAPDIKRPDINRPDSRKPDAPAPDVKPPEVKPREVKPRDVKPREVKPRDVDSPAVGKPGIDRPTISKPGDARPDVASPDIKKPDVRTPTTDTRNPSTKTPGSRDVVTKRPAPDAPSGGNANANSNGNRGADRGAPSAETGGVMPADNSSLRPTRFVSDTVGGVQVTPPGPVPGPGAGSIGGGNTTNINTTVINTTNINQTTINNSYNQYINSVSYANGWHPNSRWSSAGPCHVWQPYECRDGLSISVGFGSGGFSFGLFYGSSGAPLCSSWSNPWWEGYASYWTCAPTYSAWPTPWRGPCWTAYCAPRWTCWNPCRPWWHTYAVWTPCPLPVYTPCYSYSPFVCSTIVYTQPVVVQVPPPQPSLPNPSALWTFLAEGYDDDAEDGFAVLAAAYPSEQAWFVGQGFARAFRGETAWASDILREAFLRDPSSILRTSGDPRFVARLDALERSLAQLASGPRPSVDAVFVIAASQAARGDLDSAYFSATSAQAEGDRSAGTASFVSWLRAEIRARGTP